MTENWKPIVIDGDTTEYKIGDLGNIKKGDTCVTLSEKEGQDIKYKFRLKDGKIKTKSVHVLVATAFLDNPNNYTCVKHKNGDSTDNRVENLEWISNKIVIKKSYAKQRVCNGVPIEQYSEDGITFIKRFNSVREAAKELNISEKNFHSVLSGKTKLTGGFHFKYASKEEAVQLGGFEKMKNYENYMIDKNGQVYNIKQQTIVEPKIYNGSSIVYIDRKRISIQFLVATQFQENPNNFKHVKHIDGDKMNNHVDNLEWQK